VSEASAREDDRSSSSPPELRPRPPGHSQREWLTVPRGRGGTASIAREFAVRREAPC
jgi:hypothetical protein